MTIVKNSEFYQLNFITQVQIANLNGDQGIGGNISTIKKIKGFDNNHYVYISGQALRRYMKDTLVQMGESITAVNEAGNPDLPGVLKSAKGGDNTKILEGKEKHLISDVVDLDLFGYMLPKEPSVYSRRWSPVKVTPLVSMLPYDGHKDYLTRKQNTDGKGKSANIAQIEVDTFNFMNGAILIDTDTIGALVNEYTYEREPVLGEVEKRARVNTLIEAVKNLNGGAKQARLLNDFGYKFIVAVKQKYGNPFCLNTLSIEITDDGDVRLNVESLLDSIRDFRYTITDIAIGLRAGVFANEEELKDIFSKNDIYVTTVNSSLDILKD